MTINSRPQGTPSGFTLTELLTVLAIVSILVAVAAASYSRFISKAKSVEAEIALSEINRLQQTYFASTGMYASTIDELGLARPAAEVLFCFSRGSGRTGKRSLSRAGRASFRFQWANSFGCAIRSDTTVDG